MPKQHSLDIVAQHLASWIDDTAGTLANGMRENGHAPFAAPTTAPQRLAYYESTLFNPDGSPNVQGRMAEMQRLGPAQYAATLAQVSQTRMGRVSGATDAGLGPEDMIDG